MAILKCKVCGGDLTVTEGMKLVECEFCGTTQTIPTGDDEKKTNLFNRANRLRIASEFDRAAGIYESIIAEFPTEAEAYWGLCLCKYGIEYVDDPKTTEKIPTCHRTSFESIFNDSNYNMAISYSDSVAHSVYEREAKAIDVLQKDILNIVNKEKPFDVFICYKETDDRGNRTVDSVLAQDIYDHLTDHGFKVFFARITLEDKLGQEYEPYIFAALNSAKVMLAIGTNSEYYNAVWVKNEWSRYLSLMHNDRNKTLVPCYRDVDPYDMPPEFKNLQGQDMSKLGFIQDLTRGITKIIRDSAEKPTATTSAPTGALTKRGYFFLEDGDYKSADVYFDKALDENPEDSKAYAGKVLAGLHMKDVAEIDDSFVNLYEDKNFERAIRFSSGADKARLEDIKENADRKWFVKRLTVGLKKVAKKKETQEIFDEIKTLASTGTIESYEKIINLCTHARNRNVSGDFTLSLVNSYKRQLDILRLLSSDCEEYTIEDIKNSKYFSGTYLNLSVLAEDVKRMIADGSVENGLTPNTYCIIKTRILERKYVSALRMKEKAKTDSDYTNAVTAFKELGDYKDSATLANECRDIANELFAESKYNKAVSVLENAISEQELADGMKNLESLGDYRDAIELKTKYEEAWRSRKEHAMSVWKEYCAVNDRISAITKEIDKKTAPTEKLEKDNEQTKAKIREIKSKTEQIISLEAQLKTIQQQLTQVNSELASLGVFAFAKKKELSARVKELKILSASCQEKISQAKKFINGVGSVDALQTSIDSNDRKIAECLNGAKALNDELASLQAELVPVLQKLEKRQVIASLAQDEEILVMLVNEYSIAMMIKADDDLRYMLKNSELFYLLPKEKQKILFGSCLLDAEVVYYQSCQAMEEAHSLEDIKWARGEFAAIRRYKDSTQRLAKCDEMIANNTYKLK